MQVAVGIIRNEMGDILIAQRPQHKYKGGLWEFPGGKIEENETVFQALQRELQEELDITVLSAEPYMKFQHDYVDRIVMLNVWTVTLFTGEPKGNEAQPIRWISPHNLHHFEFPAGNRIILEKLSCEC